MNQMTMPIPQIEGQIQQWQALLDSAGEGIWGLDLEGNCTFINRMAVSSFGFDSEELVGNNMHELVHHHYPDGRHFPGSECPIYDVVRKNKGLRQVTDTMFRKNGSSFVAEISAQPVVVGGRVTGVVVTFREITERQKQQEDLHRAYELAEQKTAELDAVIESMPHGVYIATPGAGMRSNHVRQDDEWRRISGRVDDACKGRWAESGQPRRCGSRIAGYAAWPRRFF